MQDGEEKEERGKGGGGGEGGRRRREEEEIICGGQGETDTRAYSFYLNWRDRYACRVFLDG